MLKFLKGTRRPGPRELHEDDRPARRRLEAQRRVRAQVRGIYWTPGTNIAYTALNLRDPLLRGNKKLRQALAHLVDTQAEIDVLSNGRGVKLKSIVPLPPARQRARETGATYYTYDLAQARSCWPEPASPNGDCRR